MKPYSGKRKPEKRIPWAGVKIETKRNNASKDRTRRSEKKSVRSNVKDET